jgi:folate-binding protein YgfZ
METIPYSTISVTGADAFDFLQAQLTADLAVLIDAAEQPVSPLLSAWCTPKGRVICLFRVSAIADGFSVSLPEELADAAVKRLLMFRFRSKVEFEARPASATDIGAETGYDEWRLANLRHGIPEILAQQSEQFTPHMLNLDLLEAVSVTKGCYPGQEIVARTHFRGATKRRTLRFESSEPVNPGDKVSDGDREIGEVLNAIGKELLAVVPIDKSNQGLSVAGSTLVKLPLQYFE